MNRTREQMLALAGTVQAARLVDQISRTGSCPEEYLAASINTLFQFDPESVADVYGGIGGVKLGLANLAGLLANRNEAENRELVRYVSGLLHLERKFSADGDMIAVVRSRLEHTPFEPEHFAARVQEVCRGLADIYQDTISTYKYRIKVTGSMQQLRNPDNADLIRALLLAGIRSAFLWRQLGGRRWRLLLHRRRLLHIVQAMSRQAASV